MTYPALPAASSHPMFLTSIDPSFFNWANGATADGAMYYSQETTATGMVFAFENASIYIRGGNSSRTTAFWHVSQYGPRWGIFMRFPGGTPTG